MRRSVFSSRFFIGWAAGVLSSGAIAVALAVWMTFFGGFDASAAKQHATVVAWVTHKAMRSSVKTRAKDVRPPDAFTPAQVSAGAQEYEQHCIACHGGPAIARAAWASAMIPTPPYLIDSARQWSTAELYTVVRDGIKMTAMPAWGEVEPYQKIWDVVAFLDALPKMSPDEFARLRSQSAAQAAQRGSACDPQARPGACLSE